MKKQETHLSCSYLLNSATGMDVYVYTDDDKQEITMPKQIDVKMTKRQKKHGHERTWICPISLFLEKEVQ